MRELVHKYLSQYSAADKKLHKANVLTRITSEIKEQCGDEPTFVKFEDGCWWEVHDAFSREKIASMIRKMLPLQYSTNRRYMGKKNAKISTLHQSSSEAYKEQVKPSRKMNESHVKDKALLPSDDDSIRMGKNHEFRRKSIPPLELMGSRYSSLLTNQMLLGQTSLQSRQLPTDALLPEYTSFSRNPLNLTTSSTPPPMLPRIGAMEQFLKETQVMPLAEVRHYPISLLDRLSSRDIDSLPQPTLEDLRELRFR